METILGEISRISPRTFSHTRDKSTALMDLGICRYISSGIRTGFHHCVGSTSLVYDLVISRMHLPPYELPHTEYFFCWLLGLLPCFCTMVKLDSKVEGIIESVGSEVVV